MPQGSDSRDTMNSVKNVVLNRRERRKSATSKHTTHTDPSRTSRIETIMLFTALPGMGGRLLRLVLSFPRRYSFSSERIRSGAKVGFIDNTTFSKFFMSEKRHFFDV